MIQGILSPNARPGIFPANEALPAMSDLENKLHAATDSYDQYEVRGPWEYRGQHRGQPRQYKHQPTSAHAEHA